MSRPDIERTYRMMERQAINNRRNVARISQDIAADHSNWARLYLESGRAPQQALAYQRESEWYYRQARRSMGIEP